MLIVITVSFLVYLSYLNASSVVEGIIAFQDFKDKYKKRPLVQDPPPICTRSDDPIECPNPAIERNLKSILRFVNTFQIVQSHNELYELGEVDYDLTINQFSDLSQRDLERFTQGFRYPEIDLLEVSVRSGSDIVTITPENSEFEFPAGPPSIDWRSLGYVTPVKDQGYVCSSCWAFSVFILP